MASMKRMYRDRFDRKIAGVCGGMGQYFSVDSNIIRLLFILFSICTGGLLLLLYLLLWFLLPEGPKVYVEAKYKRLYRPKEGRKIAGVCAGFGKFFKIDPLLIRICVIVLFFVLAIAPVMVAYVLCAIVIPEEPSQITINS